MLVTLDLTARQATRILAQAVSLRATLEIEPRPETHSALVWGRVVDRQDGQLFVDLHDSGHELALRGLYGAMCDVRTILGGQLCLFSTHVLDVVDHAVPQRLVLAVPELVQVANRRRFARKQPHEPIPVRVQVPGPHPPFLATLCNIGLRGLACRAAGRELDDALFIGDEVELEFTLPWTTDIFRLPACTCGKTRNGDDQTLAVGFEFVLRESEPALARLRAAVTDETARLTEMDGDA